MSTRPTARSTRLRRRAVTAFVAVTAAALIAPSSAWAPPAAVGTSVTATTALVAADDITAAGAGELSGDADLQEMVLHSEVEGMLGAKRRADAQRLGAWVAAVEAAEAERRAEAERLAAWVAAVERAEAERAEAERVAAWVEGVRRAEAEAARAAEAQRAAAARAERHAAPSSAASGGGWAALRNCESGGNYSAVNPSGTYRGAYQFSRTTWNSVASKRYPHLVGVDPAAAAPGDQDAMAQALYQMAGAGQWPHCGRHLR